MRSQRARPIRTIRNTITTSTTNQEVDETFCSISGGFCSNAVYSRYSQLCSCDLHPVGEVPNIRAAFPSIPYGQLQLVETTKGE